MTTIIDLGTELQILSKEYLFQVSLENDCNKRRMALVAGRIYAWFCIDRHHSNCILSLQKCLSLFSHHQQQEIRQIPSIACNPSPFEHLLLLNSHYPFWYHKYTIYCDDVL